MEAQDIDSAVAELHNKMLSGDLGGLVEQCVLLANRHPSRPDVPLIAAQASLKSGAAAQALHFALSAVERAPSWAPGNGLALGLMLHHAPPSALPDAFARWRGAHADLSVFFNSLPPSARYDVHGTVAALCVRLEDDDEALRQFGCCLEPAHSRIKSAADVTAEYHDGAAHYDADPIHAASVNNIADYVRPALRAGSVVVDAGCGSGLAGPILRPYAERLIGIDLSPHMAALAQASGLYDTVIADDLVAALSRMPGQADTIVCLGCAYYFADLGPVLAAARTALKPNGRLLMIDHPAPAGSPVMQTIGGTQRFCRSADFTADLAAKHGFAAQDPMITLYFNLPAFFWELQAQ